MRTLYERTNRNLLPEICSPLEFLVLVKGSTRPHWLQSETQQASSTSPFPSLQLSISRASGSYLLNIPRIILFSILTCSVLVPDAIFSYLNYSWQQWPKDLSPVCYSMIFLFNSKSDHVISLVKIFGNFPKLLRMKFKLFSLGRSKM